MKKFTTLALAASLGLILSTASANEGTSHPNNPVGKELDKLPMKHCKATVDKQTKCLSFVGCREDQKAERIVCEWAWKLDIEMHE